MIGVTKTFCLTLIGYETYFRCQFTKENPSTLEIWVSSSTSASHVSKRKREVIYQVAEVVANQQDLEQILIAIFYHDKL